MWSISEWRSKWVKSVEEEEEEEEEEENRVQILMRHTPDGEIKCWVH